MISMTIDGTAPSAALKLLEERLKLYASVTSYVPGQIAVRKANDIRQALYQRFKVIKPAGGSIWEAAKARGWRVGTRGKGGKLPQRAIDRALALMGGQNTVTGSVLVDKVSGFTSTPLLRTVRVGKRGKRITGGRKGLGGRAATPEEAAAMANEGESVLNKRAVETYFALLMREAGRGFTAASFLGNRLRWVRTGGGRQQIVQTNKTGTKLGEVISESPDGTQWNINIASFVPAAGKYPKLVDEAMDDVSQDIKTYIVEKHNDAARAAGFV